MTQQNKKKLYTYIAIIIAIAFVYRFIKVGMEKFEVILSPQREFITNGKKVEILEIKNENNYIKVPVTIKNNTAFIPQNKLELFFKNQKIENGGEIISVNKKLDLDTGMYVLKTKGVTDGLNYALIYKNGIFIPTNAIDENKVYVKENNFAVTKNITVIIRDENTAFVEGLNEGDILITSKIQNGEKVK